MAKYLVRAQYTAEGAKGLMKDGGSSTEAKVAFAFRVCLTRPPSPKETERLTALFEKAKEQYSGDLERFILDLGDATKITAVISHNFTGLELLGLQEIMAQRNIRILDQAEMFWARDGATTAAIPRASFNFRRKKIDGPMAPAPAPAL